MWGQEREGDGLKVECCGGGQGGDGGGSRGRRGRSG